MPASPGEACANGILFPRVLLTVVALGQPRVQVPVPDVAQVLAVAARVDVAARVALAVAPVHRHEPAHQKHDAAVDRHAVLLARRPDLAGADTRPPLSALVYARAHLGRAVAVRVKLAHVALVAHVGFAVAARQQQPRQFLVVLAARFDESPVRATVPG